LRVAPPATTLFGRLAVWCEQTVDHPDGEVHRLGTNRITQ
jgi:hypothetical protein